MKNLVISRKGFDSTAGGRASPILENGEIFSVPIPQKKQSPFRYRDLRFNDLAGQDILNLIGAKSISDKDFCHVDPLFSEKKGIFGQAGGAQGELDNYGIERGDLFLFFGWLQVEKIIKGNNEILNYLSNDGLTHPHGTKDETQYKNNTIYVASKNLTFSDRVRDLKGHGRFKKTAQELILTEKDKTRSRWRFPQEYFSDTRNLFRNRLKWKDRKNCLVNCMGIGQEFILNAHDNPSVIDWASHLINMYGRD